MAVEWQLYLRTERCTNDTNRRETLIATHLAATKGKGEATRCGLYSLLPGIRLIRSLWPEHYSISARKRHAQSGSDLDF